MAEVRVRIPWLIRKLTSLGLTRCKPRSRMVHQLTKTNARGLNSKTRFISCMPVPRIVITLKYLKIPFEEWWAATIVKPASIGSGSEAQQWVEMA